MEKLKELLEESLELIKCIVKQQHDHLGPDGLNWQTDERLGECIQLACESKINLEKIRSKKLGEDVPKAEVEVETSTKDDDAALSQQQQNEEKGINNTNPIFISESPPTTPSSEKGDLLIEKNVLSSLTIDVASNNPVGALNSQTESDSSGSTFVTATEDVQTAENCDLGKVHSLGGIQKSKFIMDSEIWLITSDTTVLTTG